ncbi:MAG: hypothetical protein O6944_02180, partial [Gammaproteobacteria bacterium]|nr:hypothetical protein [Gammaproteobacteria bacterium]
SSSGRDRMSWDSKAPNTFLIGEKCYTHLNPKRPAGQSKKYFSRVVGKNKKVPISPRLESLMVG